jgi:Stage II sporulation protein E (SpoIIE)
VIFSGRVIQGSDGRDYVVVTVTDISEQKRVEAQLRDSNALLQDRQKEIEAELAIAERIQQSLAPHALDWKNLSVEAYFSPARTIGGDFGVVLPQHDRFLDVIVCDVSGHGVGSALMANRIYSETLHAVEHADEPAALLQRLHTFQDLIQVKVISKAGALANGRCVRSTVRPVPSALSALSMGNPQMP